MPSGLRVHAPAKINLTLEILGKREDGYHELSTIFQTIALGDWLELDWESSGQYFVCSDADIPADETNLVMKTLRAAERLLGFPVPMKISLKKEVPAGAGLGGGSSDAAAVLMAVAERYSIPEEKVLRLAEALGADVPFFLKKGTALGLGKGEKLEPLPAFPSYPAVIVKPPFPISTPFAYGRVTEYSAGERSRHVVKALKEGRPGDALANLANDFEKALFPVYPLLGEIKEYFLTHGALAANLSGSGSALYALAMDKRSAERLAEGAGSFGKVWVTST